MEILKTMREYIRLFFTCSSCREHFLEATENFKDEVKTNKGTSPFLSRAQFLILDGVLYLYNLHNAVNERISGSKTDDPLFPKKIWPSKGMTEDEILAHMVQFYSEENLSSGKYRLHKTKKPPF